MDTPGDTQKNILIISYGPVPTPDFQKIEGGGMRCWGLATGLHDNGHSVTVSVFQEFVQSYDSYQGINLHNWSLNDSFKEYLNSFDVVIVSYSMGDLSMFVADNLSHHITLVLDCYVPIFIEISARDSDDKASELKNYLFELNRFNHVLKRGDFFLCANEPQKHMYAGILGSLGVINPHSYRQNRLLMVPFGIDSKAISPELVANNPYKADVHDFVLLWMGGLYPWFNFKPLIQAIVDLSKNPHFKFYLVGGKNPYNNHPDFVKQYNSVHKAFVDNGILGKNVFLVDWIDFDDRIRWYKHANLVVSINSSGEENIYSWRTRVMDYLWGELPMMSNGGDPLSDELISRGAAIKTGLTSKEIVANIEKFMNNPKELDVVRQKLLQTKALYHWERVTKALSKQLLSDSSLPYLEGLIFAEEHKIGSNNPSATKAQKVRHIAGRLKFYTVKARQKGIRRSAQFVARTAKSQVKSALKPTSAAKRKAVFISHPIDSTGAPLVLLDVINDFGSKFAAKDIHVVAPAIKRDLLNTLLTKKYIIHKMVDNIGGRTIQAGLQIHPTDFVLVNTVAIYSNYRIYLFWLLETGKLEMAYWFIHEDNPKLHFSDKREVSRMRELIDKNKLKIIVPSTQTARDYNKHFKTSLIRPVKLRVQIPAKYQIERKPEDFNTIRFFISGNPIDGRKGQLLFLAGLQQYEAKLKSVSPEKYRPYTLDLVSIGKDYISLQILTIGQSLMGENLKTYPVLSRDRALAIASTCNVTVCTSLNETFGLYVVEGMLMGHPLIRNMTPGWQEQIKDGENGFVVDTLDLDSLVESIGKLLSKELSNHKLVEMSRSSQRIASNFSSANYYDQILRPDN